VGAGHVTALFIPGSSPLHRLPAQCKVVAALLFVLAVVATPREQVWAFAVFAVVLGVGAMVASIPVTVLLRRLTVELPFVAFAFLLPFVAGGERVDVGPLSLSSDGLWGAWNILAKGTLGVATTVVLTATTSLPDLIRGLDRLHVPRPLIGIMTFMVRYGDVIAGEMHRMNVARMSRGHDPRWFWQARAVAHSVGALFVRSYERGERVYLAMLSRGYDGALPRLQPPAAPGQWLAALAVPLGGALVASAAWIAHA
jgi:cobalt/nickel transport system permease protein